MSYCFKGFCQPISSVVLRCLLSLVVCIGSLLVELPATLAETNLPVVHMIGDSTMADKPLNPPNPERGWGQLFPIYLTHPEMVKNYALNGRSSKSFIDQGHWQRVRDAMKPGDFLVIQFGHNDEKVNSPDRYTDPATTYRDNLRRFIFEAREAGAHPILATPIARRKFSSEGKLEETHGDYPAAVRAVAQETETPLLEMLGATADIVQRYGEERSKQLYLWVDSDLFERLSQGKEDDTHLSEMGASRFSELAAAELRKLQHPLAEYLK